MLRVLILNAGSSLYILVKLCEFVRQLQSFKLDNQTRLTCITCFTKRVWNSIVQLEYVQKYVQMWHRDSKKCEFRKTSLGRDG